MTLIQILTATAYFWLAVVATRLSWGHMIRVVGACLAFASLTSTVGMTMAMPVQTPEFAAQLFPFRIILEVALSTLIMAVAGMLLIERTARRTAQLVLLLVVINVTVCAAICLVGRTDLPVRRLFGWTTNIVFALQCLCVAAPGVRDAYARWISAIRAHRIDESEVADMDWLLRRLDDR